MKKVLFGFICLFLSVVINAQKINWMTFEEALAAQAKEPKKIFMDVYTDWCGPCKLLDKNTFSNPDVIDYVNTHFYAVKFNAEGTEEISYQGEKYRNPDHDPSKDGRNSQHQLAAAMSVYAYPSIAFFDEKGVFIQPIPGYKTPRQLEVILKLLKSDDFKTITTAEAWEEYQNNFEHTFKES